LKVIVDSVHSYENGLEAFKKLSKGNANGKVAIKCDCGGRIWISYIHYHLFHWSRFSARCLLFCSSRITLSWYACNPPIFSTLAAAAAHFLKNFCWSLLSSLVFTSRTVVKTSSSAIDGVSSRETLTGIEGRGLESETPRSHSKGKFRR
jgi:hypothetical protein